MTSLITDLPAIWPLQPGEQPCPAHEAAAALLQELGDAVADAEAPLAQLGAAPDLNGTARDLGVQLRQQLATALATAAALKAAATVVRV
jgi:hypothetical protein